VPPQLGCTQAGRFILELHDLGAQLRLLSLLVLEVGRVLRM
jgi:hypothetical protein